MKIRQARALRNGAFFSFFKSSAWTRTPALCVRVHMRVRVHVLRVRVIFFRALRNVAFFSFFKSNALFVCWSFRPRRLQWSFCAHYVKSSAWTRTHTHCVCVCGCVCMCVCVLSDDGWVSCYEVGDASTKISNNLFHDLSCYFGAHIFHSDTIFFGLDRSSA